MGYTYRPTAACPYARYCKLDILFVIIAEFDDMVVCIVYDSAFVRFLKTFRRNITFLIKETSICII